MKEITRERLEVVLETLIVDAGGLVLQDELDEAVEEIVEILGEDKLR